MTLFRFPGPGLRKFLKVAGIRRLPGVGRCCYRGRMNESGWLGELRRQVAERRDPWVLLEGRAAVEAALAGWWEVAGVLIEEDHPWVLPPWSGPEMLRRDAAEMAGLGDPARHQGVLGLARLPAETAEVAAFARALEPDAWLVVCPRPSDAAYAGRLVGLAAARGAAGVLFGAEGGSPFAPAAVEASEGALFRIPVRVADGGQLLRSLKAAAVHLVGLEPSAGPRDTAPPSSGRRALVVGDPEAGLGPFWRAACDRRTAGDPADLLDWLAAAGSQAELLAEGLE